MNDPAIMYAEMPYQPPLSVSNPPPHARCSLHRKPLDFSYVSAQDQSLSYRRDHTSQIIITHGVTVIARKHRFDSQSPNLFWPPALICIVTPGVLQFDSRSPWSFSDGPELPSFRISNRIRIWTDFGGQVKGRAEKKVMPRVSSAIRHLEPQK